ncbi:hypothetical protein RUA4292_03052 [Ruegeria atlantica]|uniref:Uncharacterized protein n=1 Tax=Ruegeria atlantica TaxID=81569 RepID=A0A0P1EZG5_9RHOB|nr:hypothetical protein RUA4292_03052 [Ruegeria atlantica]
MCCGDRLKRHRNSDIRTVIFAAVGLNVCFFLCGAVNIFAFEFPHLRTSAQHRFRFGLAPDFLCDRPELVE